MSVLTVLWVLALAWGAGRGIARLRRSSALGRRIGQAPGKGKDHDERIRHGGHLLASLGRLPRSLFGLVSDPIAERRMGLTLIIGALGALVDVRLGVIAALGVWLWMVRRGIHLRRKTSIELRRGLPEALDLFALATSAGLSVRQSLDEVAVRLEGPVGEALKSAQRRIGMGMDVAEAFEELPGMYGESMRELSRPLVNSLRYGTSLSSSLSQAAEQARQARRRQAERSSRMVPLRLLLPLSVCVLPAFMLLTIVPSLASSLDFLNL